MRSLITLVESFLMEDHRDDWLRENGWREAQIGLWVRPKDQRWIIDTNSDVTMLYDQTSGYGESVDYFDHPKEAVAYIEKEERDFPKGKRFVIGRYTHERQPTGKYVVYLARHGQWQPEPEGAARFTKADAEAQATKLNGGEKFVGQSQEYAAIDIKHIH